MLKILGNCNYLCKNKKFMWTFKSFYYTLQLTFSFLIVFGIFLGVGIIVGWFISGIYNPLEYNTFGKILFVLWFFKTFDTVFKSANKYHDDNVEVENKSE